MTSCWMAPRTAGATVVAESDDDVMLDGAEMEGCESIGMISGATMLHALASGDIRNNVTERLHE
jgi:hypothetical protein